MAKVELISDKQINKIVSHNGQVQQPLKEIANERKAMAEAGLAQHTKTGSHHIEMTHGKVDYTIILVGYAAAALELGHNDKGTWVEGIHVLRPRG